MFENDDFQKLIPFGGRCYSSFLEGIPCINHGSGEKSAKSGKMSLIDVSFSGQFQGCTLPETNIAPTNGWLEYYFPIGEAYFQRLR